MLVVLVGCSPAPPAWNVLMVTIDTTRADHLGCYGNERSSTPHLDRLAAQGVLFRHAYSSIPLTLPSHSTILTGKYPPAHGVRDNGLFVLGDDQTTLAELLAAKGYSTAAAIGGFPLAAQFGIAQGFQHFDDHLTGRWEDFRGERVRPKGHIFFDERPAGRVNEAMMPWLSEHRDRPFFAWVHYYDPHQPLEPPTPYDQLFADDLYLGEIAYSDESFGNLIRHLEVLEVLDRTIVIMTSDHGEGRGQHRELTHAYLLYDSTLHVPLIVRLPDSHPRFAGSQTVDSRVSSVDILPTILDLLEIEPPAGLHGRTFGGLLLGAEREDRLHYAETLSPRFNNDWGELRALYDGNWKYIHGPRPELFDRRVDGDELENLADQHPQVAATLKGKLEDILQRLASSTAAAAVRPDDETRRKLQALGYIQGGGSMQVDEKLVSGGVPPQDRIDDVNAVSRIRQALFRGQALSAAEIAEQLVAEDPTNRYYLELLAQAIAQLDQIDELLLVIDRLVAAGATSGTAERLMQYAGRALYFRGQKSEGLRRVEHSLERRPTADGFYTASILWQAEGETQRSLDSLRKALELDPIHADAREDLAARLAESGDRQAAALEFEQLLGDHPYYPRAHYNYGVFAAQGQLLDVAAESFRRAIELDSDYLEPYFALVLIELRTGRSEAAQMVYEKLAAKAPGHRLTRQVEAMLESQS